MASFYYNYQNTSGITKFEFEKENEMNSGIVVK